MAMCASCGIAARTRSRCAPITITSRGTTASVVSAMCSIKVRPPMSSSGLGKPIRRDSPAARMTPSRCGLICIALLRALEDAETDAQREIVTLVGATLANNLGDNRNRDLFRCLAANGDAERRMNVGKPLRRDTALAEPLEGGLNAAARADHADESAGLHQRGAHNFLVERVTARNAHEIAVAVKRERVDRGLEFLDDYFISFGKALAVRERRAVVDHRHVKPE